MNKNFDLDLEDSPTKSISDLQTNSRFTNLEIMGDEEIPSPPQIFEKKNAKKSIQPSLDIYGSDYHIELTKSGTKIYLMIATLHDGNRFVFMADDDQSWSPIGEFYERTILLPLDKTPLTVGLINLIKTPVSQWEAQSFQHKITKKTSTIKKRK